MPFHFAPFLYVSLPAFVSFWRIQMCATFAGPKKDDWNRGSSNWGEPRGDPRGGGGGGDPRMGMDAMGDPRDPRDMRGVGGVGGGMDPRDMRGVGPNDPRDMRGVDMRGDPMRPMDPMRDPR